MGIRDEFADRPWEGPAEHWPDHPGVVGGRDLKAGGTWLAVDRQARRAAALLNGRGLPAPEIRKLSRGDLPLLAVSSGEMPDVDLTRYDPFHLVLAQPVRGPRVQLGRAPARSRRAARRHQRDRQHRARPRPRARHHQPAEVRRRRRLARAAPRPALRRARRADRPARAARRPRLRLPQRHPPDAGAGRRDVRVHRHDR
ncbi:NRDE family protein [Nonomuraea ferruginea]